MPHLVASGEKSPSFVRAFLGIALKGEENGDQRHVGLVYRKKATEPAQLSHLAWDQQFRDDPWDDKKGYSWQGVALDATNRATVVAFLNHFGRSKPAIPYGFRHAAVRFAQDTKTKNIIVDNSDPAGGLTCASFIECIFRSLSLPLVDVGTWPADRPGDAEWRAWVIARLKSERRTAHAKTLEENGYDVRLRPEEVASAAIQDSWPVPFGRVAPVAAEIVEEIRAARAASDA